MKTLTIGPLITTHPGSASRDPRIAPLGLQIEWATPTGAAAIPLFRHMPQHAPNRLRLEHIVFASERLPFDLECSEHQVLETAAGVYLPAEALLSQLYSRYCVERSIFVVLTELAGLTPLNGSVRCPIAEPGLLIPQVEQRGFILNSVIHDADRIYAEIGWRPVVNENVFHTCICEFACAQSGDDHAGVWVGPSLIGVHEPLSRALRHLVPGPPGTLFTPLGLNLLRDHRSLPLAITAPS